MARPQPPAAGNFSAWLRSTRKALAAAQGLTVPCGGCTACCTSSYFIPIRPEETRTLARIPKKFLAPAPGLPQGHKVLGHFEDGRCPMLRDGACSIYADRPLACRQFDCRIFAATGIAAEDDARGRVKQCVREWRFNYPAQHGRGQQAAVKAAAKFLKKHEAGFPAGFIPGPASQLAVLAVKVYRLFLKRRPGPAGHKAAQAETAQAIMAASRKFTSRLQAPGGKTL